MPAMRRVRGEEEERAIGPQCNGGRPPPVVEPEAGGRP